MTAPVSASPTVEEPDLFVRVDSTRRVLTVVGELDALTAPRLLEAAAILDQPGDVTVDLHGLVFIGAAGLNAIVDIHNTQQQLRRKLWLVGVSQQTKRVFRVGGLAGLVV